MDWYFIGVYMAAWRYEIFFLVLKNFSKLEQKFRISARPCNIRYLLFIQNIGSSPPANSS